METQLAYDDKSKQLNLAFKERLVTDSNFQLKVKGALNTRTGKRKATQLFLNQQETLVQVADCGRGGQLQRFLGEILSSQTKVQQWLCHSSRQDTVPRWCR